MAAPKFYEGQEFHDPNDSTKPVLVYRAGKFYPKSSEPGGDPSPDDQPFAPLTPGSDSRTRLAMGMGPMVDAQRNMFASEKWKPGTDKPLGINPLNKQWGASLIDSLDDNVVAHWVGLNMSPVAKAVGGQQYQDYDQASKSYEAAVLPIMSGAAVTPSEAQRQIRADLPQLGDTPETLSKKAKNRAMKINAAADLVGRPRPFPKIGTWTPNGAPAPQQGAAASPQGQAVPPAAQRKPGQVYQTPKGPLKWTGTGWVQ